MTSDIARTASGRHYGREQTGDGVIQGLYCGKKLDVLRERIANESVDLVYRPDIPYVDPTAAFKKTAREDSGKQGTLL